MIKPIPVVFESKDANVHGLFYKASTVKPLSPIARIEDIEKAII